MSKKCNENSNICCDAKNCVYHTKDSSCTATSIKVGSENACCCKDTSCATFKLKDSAVNSI